MRVAINPNRQISLLRDSARLSDISNIKKALEQYSIDSGGQYPSGISIGNYKEICLEGGVTSECVDLSFLVPDYISGIPKDPTGESYKVGINPENNTISVWADTAEQREIGLNIFVPVLVIAAGNKDASFNVGIPVGFNNSVNISVIQSDGKIIVGGEFSTYQGASTNRIIRLNANGSIDTSFNMGLGFNNTVNTIAIQGDGRIIVGGGFTTYQGESANRIIRLNSDGSRDSSFNIATGFNQSQYVFVSSMAMQIDGKIIVGGDFSTYQGETANKLIRLNSDGSKDMSFNIGTGFNNGVNSIAIQADGKIIIGGGFFTYQGVGVNYIIRLNSDGSRDTSFDMGTGVSGSVSTIAIQADGKIIIGGIFTNYQGISTNRIIRLNSDGSRDTSFNLGTGFNTTVNRITLQPDGKIVVGGGFVTYQGEAANRIIRLNSDGSRDTGFNLGNGFNSSTINNISIQSDGKIIVGGSFVTYQGEAANRIIRLNSDGSRDTGFNLGNGFNNLVYTMLLQNDGKIIVGGFFTSYQDQPAGYLIRINN
jgi:uncharacterized delta-60 repeat protein